MECYHCGREGVKTTSRGLCADCQVAVCTRPPSRNDGTFHGELCACGCHRLVCVAHVASHAAGHSGNASTCFPELTLLFGGSTLSVCTLLLDEPEAYPSGSMLRVLNDFLNVVTPGSDELVRVVQASFRDQLNEAERRTWGGPGGRPDLPALDRRTWSDARQLMVLFPGPFFDRERALRVLGLAAHAVGMAWRRLARVALGDKRPPDWAVYDALAEWASDERQAGALRLALGLWRRQAAARTQFDSEAPLSDADWLRGDAIEEWRPPREAYERADWLLGDYGAPHPRPFGAGG